MKRALAERAKQQQHNHVRSSSGLAGETGASSSSAGPTSVGTPSTLSSMSTLGSGSHASPSVMKHQHPQQDQLQQDNNMKHHRRENYPQQHQQQNLDNSGMMHKPQELHSQDNSSSNDNNAMRADITSQPPRKIPRIKSSSSPRTPVNIRSDSNVSTTTSNKKNKQNGRSAGVSRTSSNPKKRSRPSSSGHHPSALSSPIPLPAGDDNNGDEEDEVKNTKFFLKHQNSALASELYKYKHAIRVLEKEREVRREECRHINDTLREMVSFWDGMESMLIETFGGNSGRSDGNSKSLPKSLASMGPAISSGKGQDVEHVYNIMEKLIKLSKSSTMFQSDEEVESRKHENMIHYYPNDAGSNDIAMDMQKNDGDFYQSDSIIEHQFLKHLSEATSSFSSRVTNFQRLFINLIQHYISQYGKTSNDSSGFKESEKLMDRLFELSSLKEEISDLQNRCDDLEGQLEDLSRDRDNAKENERRVRRGLYRVATGRMKIAEALKTVEESSSLGIKDLEDLQKDLLSSSKHQTDSKGANDLKCDHGSSSEQINTESKAITIDGKTLSIDDVMGMKKQIDDLGLVNESKENRIEELLIEKQNLELKINSLLHEATKTGAVNEEDVKSSSVYIEMSSKLSAIEEEKLKLQNELNSVMERWACTKGDLEQSRKSINDLEEKHKRRLKELTGGIEEGPDSEAMKEEMDHAKLAVLLEHKLKHAVDNVRQAESMKSSLEDAITMKESLLRQIRDLKNRNEELEESQQSYRNDLISSESDATANATTNAKIQRLEKELNTALQSKDQARRNLEQFGKERESLMAMNTRLQEQSMEKDDMNAKSLASILHLKQLSEKLEQEKEVLEKRLKSSDQLAVMARLASNAKEKVEREAMHEKEIVENESKRLKSSYKDLLNQNNQMKTELSVSKSNFDKREKDLQSLTDRCNELVSSSTMKEKEIKNLSEELIVAKKDAVDAIQKASAATASSSTNKFESEFTAEELTIQVNSLKGRLACPVCNTRDKKVIINRCRHMFCRQCVALNLESRNRKCPSCGIRFDKKDVEDVWF